mgnify:CR=1 FL=1
MKINEVEAAVGVTKKNIRFYEEEGLISPRREPGNGYRSYSEADVERLRRIKLPVSYTHLTLPTNREV